jgi:hypothetical protein
LRPLADWSGTRPSALAAARNNENTRDAIASALVMWKSRREVMNLRASTDPVSRLEGDVWVPAASERAAR